MGIYARLFAGTCTLGFFGIGAGAVQYRREYGYLPTDLASTLHAFSTFSHDDRRDLYDVAIIGGGIVGVATARELRAKYPKKRIILLEKEADVAQHQSGHNSGCIHAGMYYKPGTAMSRLCPRGHDLIVEYCKKYKLPYELCGKLIVGDKETDAKIVEDLYNNGVSNGVKQLKILRSQEEIHAIEPNVRGCVALWSPQTGIADFAEICRHMFKQLAATPKMFSYKFQYEAQDFIGVQTPKEELVLIRGRESGHLGPEKTVLAKNVITCCGLSNDVVAKQSGKVLGRFGLRITQTYGFRGRYYQMIPEKRDVCKAHIYPVPDNTKGLSVGIHFTPTCDVRRGRQMIMGPGSAFVFDRYGYNPYFFDLEYCLSCAFSKGGWVSLWRNLGTLVETYYMDLDKTAFLKQAQRLIPSVTFDDIEESFCGVMGVGVNQNGTLNMDLAMEYARPRTTVKANLGKGLDIQTILNDAKPEVVEGYKPLIINVRNAPSPAATSCMSIAEDIVRNAAKEFDWK